MKQTPQINPPNYYVSQKKDHFRGLIMKMKITIMFNTLFEKNEKLQKLK